MTKSCVRQLQKIDESIFKNASMAPPYTRICVNVCARAQRHAHFSTRVISNSHWSSYLENVESAWDFFFFLLLRNPLQEARGGTEDSYSKRKRVPSSDCSKSCVNPWRGARNSETSRPDHWHSVLFRFGKLFQTLSAFSSLFSETWLPVHNEWAPSVFGIAMGLCRSSRLWQMPHLWFWCLGQSLNAP